MNGNEKFNDNGIELDFTLFDLWKYKYSNIYNMQETIAEFLVEKALGLEKSYNIDYWTLYDILYRGKRIEVKQTSYYHPWNETQKVSNQRIFSITKANSNYENVEMENKYERQNDIYVFCLNTGKTKAESNPLDVNNWEFYVVTTKTINKECGDNKTISLGRVIQIAEKKKYSDLKEYIDELINNCRL